MANRIETSLIINGLSGVTNSLYVTGNSFINGDVNITGNVNVIGTATTFNTETVQTRDNKILLNYSGTNLTAIGGGIEVLSGKTDGNNVSLTTDINGDWNSNTGLNISGRTSDATTNGLKVVNSLGTNNLVVRNDGNVGIGTSTPTTKLDVRGNGLFSGGVNTLLNIKSGGGGSEGKVLLENSDNNNSIDINCNSNYTWIDMKSANGGNFSIKDSNNNYKLRLGFDNNGEHLRFKDNFFISNINGNGFGMITPTGNVGIGSSFYPYSPFGDPSSKLHLVGNSNDTSLLKASQPVTGLGTISAISAGTYTQINGVGTNFTRCLNVGEIITASGLTLTITQIDNDTSLRATLDPLAIFTGQSYTLQGLTRVNVLNNGNVGIGTSTPDSKLVIKGSDSSSSNYGLKVQNSGGTNSLVVRNNNQVMVNADNTPADIRFYTKANGSTDYPLYVANSGSVGIFAVMGIGKIMANSAGDYDVGFQIGNQFNETMPFRVKNYNNQSLFAVFENGFTTTNGRANFGSNYISLPDSIVQIIGSDSSTGFGLKVKNSGGTDNFVVRNDGNVGIGTSTPDNSAILQVDSTTKGFLPPRMTGSQAEGISNPSEGLMVYITNGNGTTITSKGWWGTTGTTSYDWVKIGP